MRRPEYSRQKMMVWIRVRAVDVKRHIQVFSFQSWKAQGTGRKEMFLMSPLFREKEFPRILQSTTLAPHWSEVSRQPPITGKGAGSYDWLTPTC